MAPWGAWSWRDVVDRLVGRDRPPDGGVARCLVVRVGPAERAGNQRGATLGHDRLHAGVPGDTIGAAVAVVADVAPVEVGAVEPELVVRDLVADERAVI